jgi:D-3-phosphoglycerate dehydrogenase / 2-oxoglutarate reductase
VKILFADAFPNAQIEKLAARGHDCATAPELDAETLPTALGGVDVLVVRSTRVTEDALAAADRLSLVVRAGAGVNTIDWRAAADRGIYVCNTPGKNAVAVAELTIGLLTALDRRIPDAVADLRDGKWRKKDYAVARGLAGRTLGIVGFGEIGMAVAVRAAAFDMEIVVQEKPGRRSAATELIAELGVRLVPDLPALLGMADAVSLHVPVTDRTRRMVDRGFLSHLRPGAFLINTSRGDIVDEEALLEAIEAKGLRVGLDVFDGEPGAGTADFDSALARHPNVYGTHHIGASTQQAQAAIADEVAAIVDDFARGVIRNCVNLRDQAVGTATLAVRHRNVVGVLAGVLGVLRKAGLNVEQMENRVFAGGTAATATIHVAGPLPAQIVAAVADQPDVIGVSVAGP